MKKQIGLSVIVGLLAFCSSTTSFAQYVYAPTNVAGAGMSYVVPDMLLWYNQTLGIYTNGPIYNTADQIANNGNWEPNISAVGNSVFLIGANTFADDGTLTRQRFVVTFQPVAGGTPKIGDHFFTDAGVPYRGDANLRRNNGNPQRVAGDRRAGAVNFITAAEASLGQIAGFNTATPPRWTNNPCYSDVNAYVCSQPFSLNTSTLVQTPLAPAWDYIYGPLVTADSPLASPEVSRMGGTVIGLDDGNFVVMSDDKTGYLGVSRCTTFSIITPAGAVVKSATLVHSQDIWDNMCAYQGGFAIRSHIMLYLFDNAGNFKFGQTADNGINIQTSSGLPLDTGRGDGHRIASDIRSHYVYFAGSVADECMVVIWDANTGACVATNLVTDTDPAVHNMSRVNLAVDANDRFCVAWGMTVDPVFSAAEQMIARVGKFNGVNVTWLTPSFYAFTNHEAADPVGVALGYKTSNPSVAMTKDYICIAGKGLVNSLNNPTLPPDTEGGAAAETTLYTVLRQPVVTPPPIAVTRSGGNVVLSWTWTGAPGMFTLQTSPTVQPTSWSVLNNVVQVGNNYYSTNAIGPNNAFFSLK
jgi:hypothetical protein